MLFIIQDKIKPYVRMTQRGKWTKPEAKEYLNSKGKIGWQIKHQMNRNEWEMLPEKTPLTVSIHVKQPNALHRADLDNIVKALCDAAQGIVYQNDCWIDQITANREIGNDYITTFMVNEMESDNGQTNRDN